jgi:hypothetical protein
VLFDYGNKLDHIRCLIGEGGGSFREISEQEEWKSSGVHVFLYVVFAILQTMLIGVRFPARVGNFSFHTVSRPTLRSTQPSNQWAPGALSLGVKRPEREVDQSPPSSAKVKECTELYLHSPNTS